MGDWMDYERFKKRNHLHQPNAGYEAGMLLGDLNRMERDYLDPVYPESPFATRSERSDPATVCADETGVPIDSVQAVLRHVFARPALPVERAAGKEAEPPMSIGAVWAAGRMIAESAKGQVDWVAVGADDSRLIAVDEAAAREFAKDGGYVLARWVGDWIRVSEPEVTDAEEEPE